MCIEDFSSTRQDEKRENINVLFHGEASLVRLNKRFWIKSKARHEKHYLVYSQTYTEIYNRYRYTFRIASRWHYHRCGCDDKISQGTLPDSVVSSVNCESKQPSNLSSALLFSSFLIFSSAVILAQILTPLTRTGFYFSRIEIRLPLRFYTTHRLFYPLRSSIIRCIVVYIILSTVKSIRESEEFKYTPRRTK